MQIYLLKKSSKEVVGKFLQIFYNKTFLNQYHLHRIFRQASENLSKILTRQKEGTLGSTLVIALGTNSIKDPEESLEEIIKTLPKNHKLILVTCFDDRFKHPHKTTKVMKELGKKYDFITIMDWEKEAMAHPEYYKGTDGVHFYREKEANDAYLKLLQKAIGESIKNKGKK